MSIHNIDSSNGTVIENYAKNDDYIYNNHSVMSNLDGYVSSKELHSRGFTQSVFINTSIQEGVMCIDRNGMVTTAVYKPNIKAKEIANRLAPVDRTNKNSVTNGIYIVREWNIQTFRGMLAYCNVSLTEYYNNIEYYVKLPDSEMNLLKSKLITMGIGNGKFKGSKDVTIRSISYIPLDTILVNKILYDSHTDMIFSLGCIDKELMHPSSVRYNDMYNITSEGVDLDVNILELEVIDNFSKGKKYYTTIGKNAITLRSRTDKVKPNGVTLNITTGGYKQHGYTIPKDNLEKVGIYETIEEAKNGGDVKLGLEMAKLNLEYEKIKQKMTVLEHEKFKIEDEKKSMELKYIREKSKLEQEIEVLNIKLNTSEFDYNKNVNLSTLDVKTKMVDLKLKQTNHLTNRIEGADKHNKEMTMLDHKLEHEIIRNKSKNIVSVIDIFSKNFNKLV